MDDLDYAIRLDDELTVARRALDVAHHDMAEAERRVLSLEERIERLRTELRRVHSTKLLRRPQFWGDRDVDRV